MATPSNFYKNSAYSYKKQFHLSSIQQNLEAYNAAVSGDRPKGETRAPGAEQQTTAGSKRLLLGDFNDGHLNRLAKHYRSSKKRRRYAVAQSAERAEAAIAPPPPLSAAQPKAASVLGFDPYEASDKVNVLDLPYGEEEDESEDEERRGEREASKSKQAKEQVPEPGLQGKHGNGEDLGAGNRGLSPDESSKTVEVGGEHDQDEEVVRWRADQRFPAPDEPACVVCGRLGAYICDQTDEDVCSLECKEEHLEELKTREQDKTREQEDEQRQSTNGNEAMAERAKSSQAKEQRTAGKIAFVALEPPDGALTLPDTEPERWDGYKAKWLNRGSSLLTRVCWKCKCPGHMATECTRALGLPIPSLSDPTHYTIELPQAGSSGGRGTSLYSADMRAVYKRCQAIKEKASTAKCLVCMGRSNLAYCLDCERIFCDGKGHLTGHMRNEPYHRRFFSYKLQRQVKCSKPDCPEDDVYSLYSCHHCLTSAFDKHYNMYTATWAGAGLKMIYNCFCCEEHFDWHRYNCPQADAEGGASFVTRQGPELRRQQLSEFLF